MNTQLFSWSPCSRWCINWIALSLSLPWTLLQCKTWNSFNWQELPEEEPLLLLIESLFFSCFTPFVKCTLIIQAQMSGELLEMGFAFCRLIFRRSFLLLGQLCMSRRQYAYQFQLRHNIKQQSIQCCFTNSQSYVSCGLATRQTFIFICYMKTAYTVFFFPFDVSMTTQERRGECTNCSWNMSRKSTNALEALEKRRTVIILPNVQTE